MRTFSRWMPPLSEPPWTLGDYVLFLCFLPLIIVALAALLPLIILSKIWPGGDPLRRIASERMGEDIGTFARAFDRRTEPFDPWVVRATWEALQFVGIPLRPTDRLGEDLCIDDELDLVSEIAERTGHSLADIEANPYFARCSTLWNTSVGDLVKLIRV
jgi:hypothetical protein